MLALEIYYYYFKEWCSALKRLKKKKLRNFLAHNAYKDFKNFYTWNKRINKIFS